MSPALKQFSYTDILGWSFSRFNTFTTCKRQYYYQYYGKYDSEFSKQQIDTLKGLTTVPLEIGSIVHELIRDTLQVIAVGMQLSTLDELLERIDKLKSKYLRKNFAEIYYGEQTQIPEAEINERVKAALVNFLESSRLHWLLEYAVPHRDQWIIEPPGYGETRINNLKAYCKVDFLFPVDGQVYIIDWKTGKRKEEHRSQLLGYASWASYHLERDISQITTIDAYLLPEYQEEAITFDRFDFANFAQAVYTQTQQLYDYTESVEWNMPKPKSEFPLAESTRMCKYCNFRKFCNRHTSA
jgi:hypothetical protein